MSNISKENQNKVHQAVKEYMAAGHSANTSSIANHIKRVVGIKPSRSTIGTILRELGYEPIEQPRFVWKWNGKG